MSDLRSSITTFEYHPEENFPPTPGGKLFLQCLDLNDCTALNSGPQLSMDSGL